MRTDVLESQTPTRMFIGQNEPDHPVHTNYGMIVCSCILFIGVSSLTNRLLGEKSMASCHRQDYTPFYVEPVQKVAFGVAGILTRCWRGEIGGGR